jgi:hypothetical protein
VRNSEFYVNEVVIGHSGINLRKNQERFSWLSKLVFPGKVICMFLKHLGEDLKKGSQENISSRSSTSHTSQKSRIEELEEQLEAEKRIQEQKVKYEMTRAGKSRTISKRSQQPQQLITLSQFYNCRRNVK